MAFPHDSSGTPQRSNPNDGQAAGDPFESASPPPREDEWPIDEPLPPDFEQAGAEPETPKPAVRLSPISSGAGSSGFESNPRSSSAPPPAAAPAPAPLSRTGNPSGPRAGAPRPDDEDIFATDEPLPTIPRSAAASAAPVPQEKVTLRKETVQDEEEDEGPGDEEEVVEEEEFTVKENPGAATPSTASRPPTSKGEKLSIAALILVVLGLLGVFANALHSNRPLSEDSEATRLPDLPMKGAVATVSQLSTEWRDRREADRVSLIDAVLPEFARRQPDVLPEVKFTIDPGASKTGFLRFIFLDPDGQISGDVLVVQVAQGKLEASGNGVEIRSATEGAVTCSMGFLDKPSYLAYALSDSRRWSVEVSESADYNAKSEDWKRLGLLEIRDGN